MKLYGKKLRNTEELQQEKRRLIRESIMLEKQDFFSFDSIIDSAQKSKTQKNKGSVVGSIAEGLLSSSSPIIGLVVDILQQRFGSNSKNQSDCNATNSRGSKLLRSAAKEFIGGYLKWKAIELSYKGISLIIRKQKKKKAKISE